MFLCIVQETSLDFRPDGPGPNFLLQGSLGLAPPLNDNNSPSPVLLQRLRDNDLSDCLVGIAIYKGDHYSLSEVMIGNVNTDKFYNPITYVNTHQVQGERVSHLDLDMMNTHTPILIHPIIQIFSHRGLYFCKVSLLMHPLMDLIKGFKL